MGRASRKKKTAPDPSAPQIHKPQPPSYSDLDNTDWLFLIVITIATLAVYARTLCPTIFTSGAGENVTAVATLGIPHPPGFPLFVLLTKVFTYAIPFGNTAFRVNFFSALCGAAASGMLYVVCRTVAGAALRF